MVQHKLNMHDYDSKQCMKTRKNDSYQEHKEGSSNSNGARNQPVRARAHSFCNQNLLFLLFPIVMKCNYQNESGAYQQPVHATLSLESLAMEEYLWITFKQWQKGLYVEYQKNIGAKHE